MSDPYRVSDRAAPFDEARLSECAHPLAVTHHDPDWAAVEAALGEPIPEEDRALAVEAFGHLVRYLARPVTDCAPPRSGLSPQRAIEHAGRTVLALAHALRPEDFPGGGSVSAVARRFGIRRKALDELAREARALVRPRTLP